jgi:hypothetical protein
MREQDPPDQAPVAPYAKVIRKSVAGDYGSLEQKLVFNHERSLITCKPDEGQMAKNDPMSNAKKLAERIAKEMDSEDVGDVTVAVAILTSGIVYQRADDLGKARELLAGIRQLEDRFILGAYQAGSDVN